MKNNTISTRKMIAALLAVIMCLSITAVNAFAANSNVAGDGTSTATSVSEYDYMRMVNTGFYSWIGDAAAGNGTLDAVKYPIEYDKLHYVTGCRESAESTGICGFDYDSDRPKHITDDVKWTLKDGTLTIYGDGKMYSYGVGSFGLKTPFAWNPHIEHIVIEDGVDVRSEWFGFMPNLKTITFPAGEHTTNAFSFYNRPKLETVTVNGYVMPLESLRHYDVYNKYRCDYYVVPGISDNANICNNDIKTPSTKYEKEMSLSMDAVKAVATGTVTNTTPVADTSTVGSSNEDLSTMTSSELAVLLKQAMAEGDMERAQEILNRMNANKEKDQQAAQERAEQEAQERAEQEKSEQDALIGNKKVSTWAREHVARAVEMGIVPETGLGNDYTKAITRAQFCALAVELYETCTGTTITANASFNDTKDVNVLKMATLGVVSGYGGGVFGPDDLITREQSATMLWRLQNAMLKYFNETVDGVTYTPDTQYKNITLPFNDAPASWALDGIKYCYHNNIMNGYSDSEFGCKNNYTIEQSLVTMTRTFINW